MHGFKSFPKKTEIPFTPGINVVLGPNGSGKSNVSDAICFVLGRLSIKSMRAAKAGNLIFLGTKEMGPAKEASVEIVFDNESKVFSINQPEISIKRIVRKNGQSIYKINDETKTRQEVLTLLSQGGIDPQGFNIILQGEIQNLVRMQPEDRRGIIEEVSGISVYESRKEKSLKELEKTEERLKEIGSILRERTAYLNNLEKERQQALRYKKLEEEVRKLKASIIQSGLSGKKKESESVNQQIEKKAKEMEKQKELISGIKAEIRSLESKVTEINQNIQKATGLEQEKLNQEITNLRADMAGLNARLENQQSKLLTLSSQKKEIETQIVDREDSLGDLKDEPVTKDRNTKEIEEKKRELEKLEEQRKKFYMIKSEFGSIRERIQDKQNLLQSQANESDFLIRQISASSAEISDLKINQDKLEKLRESLLQLKNLLQNQAKRRVDLEKTILVDKTEIENQNRIIDKISKLDICPICKNKVTAQHLQEIKSEISPKVEQWKTEIDNSEKELKTLLRDREAKIRESEELVQKIAKAESDMNKMSNIEEKKNQIKNLHEKSATTKQEISDLERKKDMIERNLQSFAHVEQNYESLKIEMQEISLRTRETVGSEVTFKEREVNRLKISLKQILRDQEDSEQELKSLKSVFDEKEKVLAKKRSQEAELSKKFQSMISARDELQKKARENESKTLQEENNLRFKEQESNDLKIDRARVDAEAENLETEMLQYPNVEIVQGSKEALASRLAKAQADLFTIGSVNLRSLEVYDSIKKEYDSIKEKAETISKEKEGIMKIIAEIDIKKKKVFMQTLKQLNEIFSRNFSELSTKGHVFLEVENEKEPFEHGSGIQIIVKTGHGKYFDVKSLSGGEQTLVALSLIFAIQEYRPYYFYLLDEIDAALDKRNSERLAHLLNKYMQNGQYIIITHNDEVISRATNLYGVSMHEGISKIISMKV